MSFETYNVYFSGQLIKGQDPVEVRKKISALFRLEGDKLERLFSGQPTVIKKGVDMDQAVKYRVAFRDAGALVDIRPADQPVPETAPVSAANAEPLSDPLSLSAPNNFDLSDCAPTVDAQPIPDISALALDNPGVTLDESPAPSPLEIDTDELELDEPGVILIESNPPTPPEIDTSELALNPANEGTLEDCQKPVTPAPIPDIDHLQIAEREAKPSGKAKFQISEDE